MMLRYVVRAGSAALLLCSSLVSAVTVTDQWKTAISGDWSDASKWSAGVSPNNDANNTYLALIAAVGSPYTVTLSSAVSVGSLNLSAANATLNMTGGTLSTSTGAVISSGTFNLGGGTLSGATLTIDSGAIMNVTGWAYALNTIVNNGTINIASGNELELKGGSVQNNGYLNISNNNSFPRTPTFSYSGLEPINNTGTVVFNSTNTGGVYSVLNNNGGTLLVNSGTVFFGNNNLSFSGNSTVSGAGTFLYSALSYVAGLGGFSNSGTLTFNTAHTELYGDTTNSGKITFNGPIDFLQGGLYGSGSYNLASSAVGTFGAGNQYPHTLGSTLNNAGTLNIDPGHYINFSNGTINNSGTFNFVGSGTLANAFLQPSFITQDRFANTGTLNITGQTTIAVPMTSSSGAINFNNGTLLVDNNATFSGNNLVGGTGTFSILNYALTNTGTLTLSPSDTVLQSGVLTNNGTLSLHSILFWRSGNIGGSGTFNAASNSIVSISSGAHGLNTTLASTGYVQLAGNGYLVGSGTLTSAGSMAVTSGGVSTISLTSFTSTGTFTNVGSDSLLIAGPTTFSGNSAVHNSGTLSFTNTANLLGGAIDGNGTLITSGNFNVGGSGARPIAATVLNYGTVTVLPGAQFQLDAGTFSNFGTTSLHYASTGTVTPLVGAGLVGDLVNNGTFIVGNSGGAVSLPKIENDGTIVVTAGSVTLTPGAAYTANGITGAYVLHDNASLTIGPSYNAGTINADITLDGPGATFTNLQNATAATGSITLLNGKQMTIDHTFYNEAVLVNDASSAFHVNGDFHNLQSAYTITVTGDAYFEEGAAALDITSKSLTVSSGIYAAVGALHTGTLTIGDHAYFKIYDGYDNQFTGVVKAIKNSTGQIDLNDHTLIVNYDGVSPLNELQAQIRSGYDAGQWDGPGIISTMAFYQYHYGLGIAEASNVLGSAGGTIAGQQADGSSVIIAYTAFGDANLDGKVDIVDLGLLAGHWQQAGGWYQGDFNYDGKIDIVDLGRLASNWQVSQNDMTFDQALAAVGLQNTVPEPQLLGLASFAILALRRRRIAA